MAGQPVDVERGRPETQGTPQNIAFYYFLIINIKL